MDFPDYYGVGKNYTIDFENMTKEQVVSLTKRLFNEIDYYKKLLNKNNIKY